LGGETTCIMEHLYRDYGLAQETRGPFGKKERKSLVLRTNVGHLYYGLTDTKPNKG